MKCEKCKELCDSCGASIIEIACFCYCHKAQYGESYSTAGCKHCMNYKMPTTTI